MLCADPALIKTADTACLDSISAKAPTTGEGQGKAGPVNNLLGSNSVPSVGRAPCPPWQRSKAEELLRLALQGALPRPSHCPLAKYLTSITKHRNRIATSGLLSLRAFAPLR
jgi:hypothetical protein